MPGWRRVSCDRSGLAGRRVRDVESGGRLAVEDLAGRAVRRAGAAAWQQSHGVPSVAVWGVPSELPLAEAIVAASGGHAGWRRRRR